MQPEMVLIGDAVTAHPDVRLVLALREARGPIDRRPAAEAAERDRLADFTTVPIEIGVAPAIDVGVRIQPVAVANADKAAALGAATDEHILAGLHLAVDKNHRAANVANRHGGGGAKAVNHHLVIVRCLIDFAVSNERWGKFGRGSDTVVRFGFAVPDGLERAASDGGDIIRAQDIGIGAMFESGSLGRLPAASLAHRIGFEAPFADSDKMPPGIPPGDEVPIDAIADP